MLMMILMLAGCPLGYPNESFSEKYADKYCEQAKACNQDFYCAADEEDDRVLECKKPKFNKEQGKDCLSDDWTCDTATLVITEPEACSSVYYCK